MRMLRMSGSHGQRCYYISKWPQKYFPPFYCNVVNLRFTLEIIVICGLSQPKLAQNLHIKVIVKGLLKKAWNSFISSLLSNILNFKLDTKQYAG